MHNPRTILSHSDLGTLFATLHAEGRHTIGPTVRDGAIVYDRLIGPDDLPTGVVDEQAPGRYRLRHEGTRRFSWSVGPQSFKRWLHPPELRLFRATRTERGFAVEKPEAPPPLALIGARACELAAMAIQDRVFLGDVVDPHYASRRRDLFIVAVQCDRAASTCFCPSMGSGPRVSRGYDLSLTEVVDEAGHRFVVEIGSEAGRALAAKLPLHAATTDADAPERASAEAEAQIARRMPTDGLREKLLGAVASSNWDDVASRCIGCANCTLVCPTCFCTTVDDVTTLDGTHERVRRWDSCFHPDFSYLHGAGPVRSSVGARYRQWLTHKLATWHDQFGTSGCVGCGRCVAWCPAGIDIVAEAERLAEDA
ncbi:MAG: sulfite reductase subunit A [Deltaproteobacteria bacterium]|nr:MAG: sulfite reductase subunit A [Deltaproteobacteria bacterium]